MIHGLILVMGGLLGAAIGVILWGIWLDWWSGRQIDSVWTSKGELRLYLIDREKEQ